MINNFDLKKFLVENKVTLNSRLNEEEDFEDFTTTAPPECNIPKERRSNNKRHVFR